MSIFAFLATCHCASLLQVCFLFCCFLFCTLANKMLLLLSSLLFPVLYVRSVYCPTSSGFTYNSNSAGQTCFQVATQTATWSDASSTCHALHQRAHLVVIHNDYKQTTVKNFLGGEDMCNSIICDFRF